MDRTATKHRNASYKRDKVTIDSLKGDLRKKMLQRIKDIRLQNFMKNRCISDNDKKTSYVEIYEEIVSSNDYDLLDPDEFFHMCESIERELLDDIEREVERERLETGTLVEALFTCRICEEVIQNDVVGDFCYGCSKKFFTA